MKIKTRFVLSMFLFGLTLSVIALLVAVSNQQVSQLEQEEEIATSIGRGASELSYLSNDYLRYREKQQISRWNSKWASIVRDVSRLTPSGQEERAIANDIKSNLRRLKGVFADVSASLGSSSRPLVAATSEAFVQVSWSRMAVQEQGIAFDALRLSELLRGQKARVEERSLMLVVVLLGVFVAYFISNYVMVYRRALRSLSELQAGTRLVGSGNLDHVIPVQRNDEIGGLSRAFNRMTADLKSVMASKAEVEREVEERRRAEEGLRRSLEEQRRLAGQLETERGQLEAIFETIEEAVGIWSPEGEQLDMNDGTVRMYGFSSREQMLRHLSEFSDVSISTMDGQTLPMDEWPAARVIRGERFSDWELETSVPSNDVRFIGSYSGAPVLDGDGNVLLGVVTVHDVTDLYEAREAVRRELDTTKRLLAAADALAEWTDLNLVLEGLADIILESTGHTRVVVQLWDEARRQLGVAMVRGKAGGYRSGTITRWDDMSGPAQAVIETARPSVVDYDSLPEERRGRGGKLGARLGLIVPLVHAQRLLGVVRVDDPGERREFGEREVELIHGIASQAAVAIENARLYEEEHKVAEVLRAVFEHPVPSVPGVALGVVGRSASEAEKVGGDFYDVFSFKNQAAVLVGDVAGKGVGAVGLTERVRSAVRALAHAGGSLSPAFLLNRVNESLMKQLPPNEFITSLLLTVDLTTGEYRLADAGHPAPVICGAGGCRQAPVKTGPPLGVLEGDLEETSGILKAGETLIVYTDGVTEARRDSQFYGEKRLLRFLEKHTGDPQSVSEALFADVQRFAQGKLADDLLILALRLDVACETQ